MSYAALAAVLALDDASAGERLAAFSLASFANREHQAWPSTPVAAARAGLSRSHYLAARDGLVHRGLVQVDDGGGGRGRTSICSLRFAEAGPRVDLDVNPQLVEMVLAHSRTRGSARVLLATLAAVADDSGAVAELSSEDLQALAGIADSTYRRARSELLRTGELVLACAGGGRARTNRWSVTDPRTINPTPIIATQRRPGRPAGARPLLNHARPQPEISEQIALQGSVVAHGESLNPPQPWTVSAVSGPTVSGVSPTNPPQPRTVSPQTPPKSPPQTPPPHVRAGKEPENLGIDNPPNPPEGGPPGVISTTESYITAKGRRRRRTVDIDLEQARKRLHPPSAADHANWQLIRGELELAAGADLFTVWLDPITPLGRDGDVLLLSAPEQTRGWILSRYGILLDQVSDAHGLRIRLSDQAEIQTLAALQTCEVGAADEAAHHPDAEEAA